MSSPNDIHLPARAVCERYSVSDRTVARWLANEALGFPRPIVINHRRYWSAAALQEWERARAAAPGAA